MIINGRATRYLIVLAAMWLAATSATGDSSPDSSGADSTCDLHAGACSLAVGDLIVTLAITPRPIRAMTDLYFHVSVIGDFDGTPYIDLDMVAMHMGRNRVRLASDDGESARDAVRAFRGTGVVVKCPSGKRAWKATVVLPDIGEAVFHFDVAE